MENSKAHKGTEYDSKYGIFTAPENFTSGTVFDLDGKKVRLQRIVHRDEPYLSLAVLMEVTENNQKKVTTTVFLREDQREGLHRISSELHIPFAELVRQGIDGILDKHNAR